MWIRKKRIKNEKKKRPFSYISRRHHIYQFHKRALRPKKRKKSGFAVALDSTTEKGWRVPASVRIHARRLEGRKKDPPTH